MITFTDAFALTADELKTLGELHGKLHRAEICGVGYLFRRLYTPDWQRLEEFRNANPNIKKEALDEKLVDVALIGPKPDIASGGWSNTEAGILPTLAMLIKAKSGFVVQDFADQQLFDVEEMYEAEEPTRPDAATIEKLKATNKFKIKGVRIEDLYVVVRPLTRIEWKNIQKADPENADKVLCEKTVLWPENIDWDTDYPVGYADTLSQTVLNLSGFTRPQNIEDL